MKSSWNAVGKEISEETKAMEFDCPLLDFHVFNISFFVWRDFEFNLEICETSPYTLDGDIPLIFIKMGWIELIFESKHIYKRIYKKRHGYDLDI